MTWTEIINVARRQLNETTAANLSNDYLKQYGIDMQRRFAVRAPGFFITTRTFTTVASTGEYTISTSLGPDVGRIWSATYDDYPLDSVSGHDLDWKSVGTAIPHKWYRRKNIFGLYRPPNGAKTAKAWYSRIPPRYVLSIIHDAGASATAATVAVSGNTMSLVITGGTNAGTTTIDLSAAAYDTLSELAAYIIALAKGFTATVSGDVLAASETSTLLEDLSATSCYGATGYLYEDPEMPQEYIDRIQIGIVAQALWELGEYDLSDKKNQEWDAVLAEAMVESRQQIAPFVSEGNWQSHTPAGSVRYIVT